MILAFTQFVGMNSDVSAEQLPSSFAVEATDTYTEQGELKSWKQPLTVSGTWNNKTGRLNTLYYLNNEIFLAWREFVDVVPVQKKSNLDSEILFTGTDKPRFTNRSLARQGGGNSYPTVSYGLGVPTPKTAPNASRYEPTTIDGGLVMSRVIPGTVGDNVGDRIARTFVYTFISKTGREGAPSPASEIVYANDSEEIILTGFEAPPNADVNGIKLYMASGGETFNYLSAHSLPLSSLTLTKFSIGSAISTTLYSAPPDGMIGVVTLANGITAGFMGNNVYLSEPYQTHAYPEDYILVMPYSIIGLAAKGNYLYIMTEGGVHFALVTNPSTATTQLMGGVQPPLNRRSIVDMGATGIMYSSIDGVVLLNQGQSLMISDGIISEEMFRSLQPVGMHAYFYRDKYICFYDANQNVYDGVYNNVYVGDNGVLEAIQLITGERFPSKGAFVLDAKRKTVSFLNLTATTGYSDRANGMLYLVQNNGNSNTLVKFNEGSSSMTGVWRCRPTITAPVSFSTARVFSRSYPVTFELYADGNLKHTQTVTDNKPFRLPNNYRARSWSPRITGANGAVQIFVAQSLAELQGVSNG